MRVLQFFSLALSLASSAVALPQKTKPMENRAPSIVDLKNFSISNLYTHSFVVPDQTTWNRTISFLFTDPNKANSSTICTRSWTEGNGTNNAPLEYVNCDFTGDNTEIYHWHFKTYTNIKEFSIQFAHIFSDPTNYPPPYDVVQYFAEATFNLTCVDAGGLQGCNLPKGQDPLSVPINGITD